MILVSSAPVPVKVRLLLGTLRVLYYAAYVYIYPHPKPNSPLSLQG